MAWHWHCDNSQILNLTSKKSSTKIQHWILRGCTTGIQQCWILNLTSKKSSTKIQHNERGCTRLAGNIIQQCRLIKQCWISMYTLVYVWCDFIGHWGLENTVSIWSMCFWWPFCHFKSVLTLLERLRLRGFALQKTLQTKLEENYVKSLLLLFLAISTSYHQGCWGVLWFQTLSFCFYSISTH